MNDAVTCRLDWTGQYPRFIIEFHKDIHPLNIKQLAYVIEQTITQKLNCMLAESEACDGCSGRIDGRVDDVGCGNTQDVDSSHAGRHNLH